MSTDPERRRDLAQHLAEPARRRHPERAGLTVRMKTAGPSNIGNLLARAGSPAVTGFGVPCEGLHGTHERAHLAELPQVYAVYRRAVLDLLAG